MRKTKFERVDHRRMSRAELAQRLGALQETTTGDARHSIENTELREVLHELEVSQIELEVQNRELVDSRRSVDESHDRYIELYDLAPVGYVTLTAKGMIKEINLTAAELLGIERRTLVGRSFAAKLAIEDRQRFREHIMHCRDNGGRSSVELSLLNKQGNATPIQLLSTCAREHATGELIFRSAINDLSAMKSVEEELKVEKYKAELASQTKSAFLANMSHEIRTPLAAILGFTDLIRSSVSPDERAEFSNIVARNGSALTKLIDDILDLTKVEAGRLQLERVSFNIRNLVKEVTVLFHSPIQKKNLGLEIVIDSDTPDMICSDPTRIRQILINLIGNATKFTAFGSISLRVQPTIKDSSLTCLKFIVTDTGLGMSWEQASKLFSPFAQADNSTTRKFGGSGLGLALSQKLARALGGDVVVKDCAPGVGCTFVASVGAGPSDHVEEALMANEHADQPTPSVSRILLVEDSLDNQTLVKLMLSRVGMVVDIANNGAEGVKMAVANKYDVVLMDMQMPVLDGYAATEQLRHEGYSRPIVALTAHAMIEDRRRSLELGCNAHLTKPLNAKLLVETIHRLQM